MTVNNEEKLKILWKRKRKKNQKFHKKKRKHHAYYLKKKRASLVNESCEEASISPQCEEEQTLIMEKITRSSLCV